MARPTNLLVTGAVRRNRASLLRSTALQAAFLTVIALPHPAGAQPAPGAHPMGGQVVAGAAQITRPNAATTVITQSTDRAALNWTSFSVGAKQSVDFVQPSASAMTLNRVTGPDPSAIAGQIHANGGVVLTNPNGVMFYKGAQVNAQNVIVSTAGITNQNFMAGHLVFDQPGNARARIDNAGTITVKETGLAALVAPQVANSGVISATLGHVVLAGAQAATLDMYGDGLLSVDVTKQVMQAPIGRDGRAATVLVTNTGTIVANGGQVLMSASAADGVVQNLVSAGGRITADSVGDKTGSIAINGTGGGIVISGRLAASGLAAGTTGGSIALTASKAVRVAGTARIDASGAAGGGTVAIGSSSVTSGMTAAGTTAASTTIAHGARITANATKSGNGGRVTVLSIQNTVMGGTIEATGGRIAGNGGTVEVSAAGVLALDGRVDVTAPHGLQGGILLDPGTLDITSTPTGTALNPGPFAPNVSYSQGGTIGTSYITPAQIEALSGNIDLQASADINVLSAVNLTGSGQFELQAGGNLTVGAPISAAGAIFLQAGNALSVQAPVTATNQQIVLQSGAGGIQLNANVAAGTGPGGYIRLSSTGGAVTQTGGILTAGTIAGYVGAALLTQPNVVGNIQNFYATNGGFSLSEAPGQALHIINGITVASGQGGITLAADTLTSGFGALSAPGGDVTLKPATAGRPIELIGTGAATAGELSLGSTLLNSVTAGTLTVGSPTAGAITIGRTAADVIAFGNTLALYSGGLITQGGGVLSVGALTGSALGVSLPNTANSVANLAGFTATGGSVTLATSGSLTVSGPVRATGTIGLNTYASLYLQSNLNAPGITLGAGGAIEQNAGTIGTGTLTATSGSGAFLQQANQIGTLGNISANYYLAINNAAPLAVAGSLSATGGEGSSSISLSSSGALSFLATARVAATFLDLTAGGAIVEDPAAIITANGLTGTAPSANFAGTLNNISYLNGFTLTAAGSRFSLVDATPLNVYGTVGGPGGSQIALFDDFITLSTGSTVPGGVVVLSAPGGGVTLAPLTAGRNLEVITSGTANAAALSLPISALSDIVTGTLTLGSPTTGPINLGNIATAGTVDSIDLTGIATTLNLVSRGAVTQGSLTSYGSIAGGISVTSLTGNAASLLLPASNSIANLGSFAVTGNFGLNDTQALTVAGPLTASVGIDLRDGGGVLTLAGSIAAPTVAFYNLTNGAITQTGGGVGANTLYAAGSAITLGGSLNNIVATDRLTATAGGVTLVNQGPFTVNGYGVGRGVTATGNVSLTAKGSIKLDGTVATGAAGVLTLQAPGYTISDTLRDRITAGTLTGTAGSLNLPGNDAIGTLGNFTSTNGLFAQVGVVAGTVTDQTRIVIEPRGSLILSGILTAPYVTLTTLVPGGITQTGGSVNGTQLVSLAAGTGGIIQTGGSLTGGALSASDNYAVVSLPSTRNAMTELAGGLGNGGFTLVNSQPLAVTGAVSNTGGILSLATVGSLAIGGALTSPNGIVLAASGAITEPAGGALTTGTLSVTGGSVALGQTANAVGTLVAGSGTLGGFALADGIPLTVAGSVSAAPGFTLALDSDQLTLSSIASLSALGGTLALGPAGPADAFTLVSPGTLSPEITATTVAIGSTLAGTVTLNGVFDFPNALDLRSGAGITQVATGAITAASLTGASLGPVSLAAANSITNLGSFSSVGGFSLANVTTLTVVGPVTDTQFIGIQQQTGDLLLAGSLAAPTVSLYALRGAITQVGGGITTAVLNAYAFSISLPDANSIAATGFLSASGGLRLADQTGITLGGGGVYATDASISAHGNIVIAAPLEGYNSVALTATGTVGETGAGIIRTPTLSGSAAGVSLVDANYVGTLAAFTSSSGFVLTNATSLTVNGPVSDATAIALTGAGGLYLAGNVTAPLVQITARPAQYYYGVERLRGRITQGVSYGNAASGFIQQTAGTIAATTSLGLAASGAITQAGGTLVAGLLTATGGGTVALPSQANLVAALGSVSSVGGFLLNDGSGLSISGPVGDTAMIALATQGSLAVGGQLTAPTVALTATGAVSEPAGGAVSATSLAVSGASVALGQTANAVGMLIAGSGTLGGFALSDGTPLLVAGTVSAAPGATLALNSDRLTVPTGTALSAPGGTVALGPAGVSDGFTLVNTGSLSPTVTAAGVVIGTAQAGMVTLAGTFDFSSAGSLDLRSGAGIGELATTRLSAAELVGSSGGPVALTATNTIGALGSFAGTGGFVLADASALTVNGPLTDTVRIALDTAGSLVLNGALSAPAVTLYATGGAITQIAGGITTAGLTASASAITLGGTANAIAATDYLNAAGSLALIDGTGITLGGSGVFATSATFATQGNLTIAAPLSSTLATSLSATGGVSETGSGSILTATLSGTAHAATLSGANYVGTLAGFTSTAGFALSNSQGLTVAGPVADGTAIALASAGAMTLAGNITAPLVQITALTSPAPARTPGVILQTAGSIDAGTSLALSATGAVYQTGGSLVSGLLTVAAGGVVDLPSQGNLVASLGSAASAGGFFLSDGSGLTVAGPVSDTAMIALATTGTLALGGTITAPVVALDASGAITQPGGAIDATSLTGRGSAVTLGQANQVGTLSGLSATANLLLADAAPLVVAGTNAVGTGATLTLNDDATSFAAGALLSAPSGIVVLAPATPGGPIALGGSQVGHVGAATLVVGAANAGAITIGGSLDFSGVGVLDLASGAGVSESAGSILVVNTLGGSAASIALTGTGNTVAALGTITTVSGFSLVDQAALSVIGPVADGRAIALTSAGSLTLGGSLAAPSVSLVAGGAITQTGGIVSGGTLSGSAGGAVSLTDINAIGTLAGFASNGGFAFADGQNLTLAGPVGDSAIVNLAVAGSLVLAGSLSAPVVDLSATGGIAQTGGLITATTLAGANGGSVSLGQANQIGTLGGLSAAGNLSLTDATPLVVAGTNAVGLGATLALNDDALSFAAGALLSAPSGIVALAPATPGDPIALGGNQIGHVGAATLVVGAANAGAITIGGSLDFSGVGVLDLASGAGVSESAGSILVVNTLSGSAASIALTGAGNTIAALGTITTVGGFSLVDQANLGVIGPVADGRAIALSSAGSLTLGGGLAAPSVSLVAGRGIAQTAGIVSAGTLLGSAGGAVSLTDINAIGTLAGFASSSGFALADGQNLTLAGPVGDSAIVNLAVAGSLVLAGSLSAPVVDLSATGGIAQTGGLITATTLAGANGGSVSLAQANSIGTLGGLSAAGNLLLADGAPLVVAGTNTVGTGATLALNDDAVSFAAGALLSAPSGIVVLAPATPGDPIALGGNQIGHVGAATLVVGAANAGAITIGGSLDFSGVGVLDLASGAGVSESTGSILVVNTLSGAAASIALTGAGNTIAALGTITTAGGFSLVDQANLGVIGPVADGRAIALSSAGSLTLGGSLAAPSVSLVAGGGIAQTGGIVSAGTLSGSAGGAVSLTDINAIGTLAGFASSGGFALADGQSLMVAGPVGDSAIVNLAVAGSLVLAGSLSAPVVDLSATGGIAQTGGLITATTLAGANGGSVSLAQANSIGTLGGLSAAGNLSLTDATPLVVAGTNAVGLGATLALNDDAVSFAAGALLSAPSGIVVLAPAAPGDPIALGGSQVGHVGAATLVVGAANAGAITIGGSLDFSGVGVLDLASGAGVSESAGSILVVNTLSGSAASIALTGTGNTVAALGTITTAGGFSLVDQATLSVIGPVADGRAIALTSAGSLTLGGSLAAPSVSLVAGRGIAQTAGIVSAGTLSGSAGGAVSLTDINAVGTLAGFASSGGFAFADGQNLTLAGPVGESAIVNLAVAGSLVLAGSLSAPVVDLSATGGIAQTGGLITATTLAGANGGSVSLAQANQIGTLGGLSAAGNLSLTDATPLVVAGTNAVGTGATLALNDDAVSFAAGALLSAPSGIVALAPATPGDPIALGGSQVGHVGAATLVVGAANAGAITIGGSLDFSGVGVVDLASGAGVSESAGSILVVNTLSGSAASIALTGAGNTVATLGAITTAGGFSLVDQANLGVIGPVADAHAIALTSAGSLTLGGSLAAPSVSLVAGRGIAQTAGIVSAGTLSGSAGGAVSLAQANSIGTLGGLSAAGNLSLTDAAPLVVAGTNSVGLGATLTLNDDAVSFAAGALLSAPSGIVVLAPATPGDPIALGGGEIGHVGAATLVVGAANAGAITIGGSLDFSGVGVLDLASGAGVGESAGSILIANTLAGAAATMVLTGNGNTISQLGAVTTSGLFSLNDQGPLRVAGPVVGGTGIALGSTGSLTLAGSLSAPSVSLTAGGGLAEIGGMVVAGTLSGSAGGAVSLNGTNAIGSLAGFASQGGFMLADGQALAVTGAVRDSAMVNLAVTGGLSLAASLSAPVVNLSATSGVAQTGGIITATTLTGTVGGTALLPQANEVGTLAGFVTGGGFLLTDATPLTVAGTNMVGRLASLTLNDDATAFAAGAMLSAPSGTVVLAPATQGDPIALAGARIGAATVVIGAPGAGAITLGGSLDLSNVAVLDLASGAGVGERPGSLLIANTLAGSAASIVLTGAANTVAALGAITTASGFSLVDQSALAVAGPVVDGTAIALTSTGSLTLGGNLSAPSVSLVAAGAIAQSGGVLTAGSLSGSAASIMLPGGNAIAAIGSLASSGSIAVADTVPVVIAGPVTAASLSIADTGAVSFTGPVTTGALSVVAGGEVVQSAGTITTGTLSGSAVGLAQFGPDDPGPVANIGTLAGFTVTGGTLDVAGGQAMTVTGPLSADAVNLSAPDALILSGGTVALTAPSASTIAIAEGAPGTIAQLGTTVVTSPSGAVLTFLLPSGGGVSFDNLSAADTAVILNLGNGTASGNLDVAGLNVTSAGAVRLSGTIAGISGPNAALAVGLAGPVGPDYTLNACQIGAVTCTVTIATAEIPPFQPTQSLLLIPFFALNLGDSAAIATASEPVATRNSFNLPFLNGLVSFIFSRDINDPDLVLPNIAEDDF